MYTGYWFTNNNYKRGDIVFVNELLEYYICIKPHKSNNLTFPNKIDMYWVSISSAFLDDLIKNTCNYTNYNFTKDNQNEQEDDQEDNQEDNPKEKNDVIKLKPIKMNTILKIITANLNNHDDDFDEVDVDEVDVDDEVDEVDEVDVVDEVDEFAPVTSTLPMKFRQGIIKATKATKAAKALSDDGKCTDYIENQKQNDLKKRLRCIEDDLQNHKRQKLDNDEEISSLRDRLLLMNTDLNTKSFIIDKYDNTSKMYGSDYSKGMNWIKTVSKIPYGKYKSMPVTKDDSQEKIKDFFDLVKQKLDKNIYGLEEVKQEMMEFVAFQQAKRN